MGPLEYAPERRTWLRDVIVNAAGSLGANVLWIILQAAAHHFG
ncbi:DUF6408 family protein [Streptomyces beihaiensis]